MTNALIIYTNRKNDPNVRLEKLKFSVVEIFTATILPSEKDRKAFTDIISARCKTEILFEKRHFMDAHFP